LFENLSGGSVVAEVGSSMLVGQVIEIAGALSERFTVCHLSSQPAVPAGVFSVKALAVEN